MAYLITLFNDKLYSFRSRFFISFNYIDNKYQNKDKSTNFYMLTRCIKVILDNKKYKMFENQVNNEINKLSKKLKSINIKKILTIMGYPN